jgi:hypothetical protein
LQRNLSPGFAKAIDPGGSKTISSSQNTKYKEAIAKKERREERFSQTDLPTIGEETAALKYTA